MRRLRLVGASLIVAECMLMAGSAVTPASAQPRNRGPLPSAPQKTPTFELSEAAQQADYDEVDKKVATVHGADEAAARLIYARTLRERGRFDEAVRALAPAKASSALHVAATSLEAEIAFAQGQTANAMRLLDGIKSDKSPAGRHARVVLGAILIGTGKRDEASDPLHEVVDEYQNMAPTDAEGLADVGRAAYLLRSPKDANQAYTESEKAHKGRMATLLERAALFLEKYDPGHAEEVARDALKLAPKNADALVIMARIKLEQSLDFDAAEELVKKALAVNPKHTGAFAVRAGIAIRDMELESAEKSIAAGLAVNPNDLELRSLRAAVRFLADDPQGFAAAKKEVFARNAEYAEFYLILAEFLEWEHRYDDIVAMMKEATTLDPDEGRAWADLGLTSMRNGNETEGMAALNKAWSKDKFNVRVYNTLNLYEKTLASSYELKTTGPFKLRYPKDEQVILERYLPQFMGDAYGSMKARYGFVPQGPVQIELYGNRESFSVRTSGLPNIGIQGVCFGKVVAAMSPQSEPFNWGNVLWHELGHVFAIQLSKNHVPRWFTEGLSEYETIAKRPEWQRELDPQLYLALKEQTLPDAVSMNRAFTHASDGLDVTVAYYAASQMLLFTVEQFGIGKVKDALVLWGEGKKTADVLQRAFGVSASDYDTKFRAWARARLRRYDGQFVFAGKPKALARTKEQAEKNPKDAHLQAEFGFSQLSEGERKDAVATLEGALKLDPGEPLAHYILARVAGPKDMGGAIKHLEAMRAAGHDGYPVQMMLAQIYDAKKDKDKMRFALESARRWDPVQSEPIKGLYDLAVEAKQDDVAIALLTELAPLDQHDRKVWRTLLEKLVAKKSWEEARRVGESALFVDIHSSHVHELYAESLAALGMNDAAIFEAESALLCKGKATDASAAHSLLVKLYGARKDTAQVKSHEEAIKKLSDKVAEEAKAAAAIEAKKSAAKKGPADGDDD